MDDKKLVVKRTLDAPIDKVFAAFSEADQLKGWFAPEGLTTPEVEVDLREGGSYKIVMEEPTGAKHIAIGTFKNIVKPNHLTYTWEWQEEGWGGETLVDIKFNDLGENKTEVIFTHSGFKDDEQVKSHTDGWESAFNKLEKILG